MRIAASLLALLVLLAGTVPAVAVAVPGSAERGAQAADTAGDRPALAGPSPARIEAPTVTEIALAPTPGGAARWSVSVRYNLSSAADRAAFDRYGRTFEAGDADVGLDVAFFRTLASEASRATGREMAITNADRNATVHNGTGTLRLSFTWTNFVTDTEDGFRIQEAALMPGNRTWLASIGPDQRLVVETPEGYQVTDTRFGLENQSVVVQGPHTFREPLSISYQRTVTEEPESETPWFLVAGALLVGLGLVAAVVYVRRSGTDGAAEQTAEGRVEPGGTTDQPGAGNGEPDDDRPGEDATPGSEVGVGAGAGTGTEAAAGDDATDAEADAEGTVDPSLLSDEERVERLLDRNGGRMKQARIVKETGWSDAKVSQLLSTMADDGRVEKLRLGRENLISLPDEEP
jgi:hypothetical protein